MSTTIVYICSICTKEHPISTLRIRSREGFLCACGAVLVRTEIVTKETEE